LTAAIYAARFRLRTMVVDSGHSRAGLIPRTQNYAGFPKGVSGFELLSRMREQAKRWGADVETGRVDGIERDGDGLVAVLGGGDRIAARAILLATGVTNRRPGIDDTLHAEAVARGFIRYCPICDGFEVTDKNIAVIGAGEKAVKEAAFLRAYTRRVTVVAATSEVFEPALQTQMSDLGMAALAGPPQDFRIEADRLTFDLKGERVGFDSVYVALGSDVHSKLAAEVGATLTSEGCVKVDAHQRTDAPFVYAAGDVVIGLDQISHAMGEAGVAATTIRNDLAAVRPLLR
jgi:thioredoxin reductase (NADPH)